MKFDELKNYQQVAIKKVKEAIDSNKFDGAQYIGFSTEQFIDLETASVIFKYSSIHEHLRIDKILVYQNNQEPIEICVTLRRKQNNSFFIANLSYKIKVTRSQCFDIKCHNYLL